MPLEAVAYWQSGLDNLGTTVDLLDPAVFAAVDPDEGHPTLEDLITFEADKNNNGIQEARMIGGDQNAAPWNALSVRVQKLGAHPKQNGRRARDLHKIVQKIVIASLFLLLLLQSS